MMKRFYFRLIKVLEYRKNLETRAQKHLAAAKSDYRQKTQLIRQMKEKRQALAHERRKREKERVDAFFHQAHYSFMRGLDHRMSDAQKDLDEISRRIRKRRADLKAASKERETLEILNAKQHSEYTKAAEKQEQKESDELALITKGYQRL